jgi:MFS family permease
MWFNNYGKFVIYYALVSLTLTIASPFFAVYILKELNLGYIAYMAIIISPAITGFLFMTGLGKFTDSYGNINLIKICGYLTPAIPFLWLISFFIYPISPTATIIYLVIIEAIGGLVWAGFNLSANNFIYEAVTKERIAICVSYFNVINGIGVFIGPLIGGILASKLPTTFGLSALLIVFIISGVSRFAVSFYMIPKIKEVRKVKKYGFKEVKESFTNLSLMDFVEYLEINMLKTRPV